MSLKEELGLLKPFKVLQHEALLNVYFTASQVRKHATEFFKEFGLTDVQFNVMMLLNYQTEGDGGLSQAKLSDMMLVNRANITSLVDRMEKAELVVRTATEDRRFKIVKLTMKGKKLLGKVEPLYAELIGKIMSPLKKTEQKALVDMLERVREGL